MPGCEVILLPLKHQMSESRSSTICVFVEWPDHRCGNDLVLSVIVYELFMWLTLSSISLSSPYVLTFLVVEAVA